MPSKVYRKQAEDTSLEGLTTSAAIQTDQRDHRCSYHAYAWCAWNHSSRCYTKWELEHL